MSAPGALERLAQVRRLYATEGGAGVAARLRERAARRLSPPGSQRLPVDPADMQRAAEIAAGGWRLPSPAPWEPGKPMHVAWVCVPPSAGSGGHGTMFRMVGALERAGHRCVVYLQDRHGWSLERHRQTIRGAWPTIHAEIRDLAGGIEDAHAIFATGWMTAYPVLASPALGARCYFVQDYEPWFFPAGSEALLAEATYHFPFHAITAGSWLAQTLERRFGTSAEHFDFGLDPASYQIDRSHAGARNRTGVCYYCRPSTPRRAHELALVTLELFAAQHPEVEIHFYGERCGKTGFAFTHHGLLGADQLGALYNRCIAGLALSATNVSLVPLEMLAAGCIPVVNDASHNRAVLDNPHVAYAPATPFELAGALSALVQRPAAERANAALRAASSVVAVSWEGSGRQFESAVRGLVAARQPQRAAA